MIVGQQGPFRAFFTIEPIIAKYDMWLQVKIVISMKKNETMINEDWSMKQNYISGGKLPEKPLIWLKNEQPLNIFFLMKVKSDLQTQKLT